MIHSQMRIANERVGFDVDNLLAVQLDLPDAKFRRPTGDVLDSNALAMEIDPQMRIVSEQNMTGGFAQQNLGGRASQARSATAASAVIDRAYSAQQSS